MKIHIVVVAHKDRADTATQLANTVQSDHISLDNGDRGVNANHRHAWNWHQHHPADWAVTLEDDAQPCEHFRDQLEQALTVAPTHLVSLYLGRQHPEHWQETIQHALIRADRAKAHWIIGQHNMHGVGLCADRSAIPMMVYALTLYSVYAHDEAVSIWCTRNNIDIAYTVPSLVNHDDTLLPLIEHINGQQRPRQPGRVAWRCGTRRKWTGAAVPLVAPVAESNPQPIDA